MKDQLNCGTFFVCFHGPVHKLDKFNSMMLEVNNFVHRGHHLFQSLSQVATSLYAARKPKQNCELLKGHMALLIESQNSPTSTHLDNEAITNMAVFVVHAIHDASHLCAANKGKEQCMRVCTHHSH